MFDFFPALGPRFLRLFSLCATLSALTLAQALHAENGQMRFDIRLGALKVGLLQVAARETNTTYAVSSRFRDAGLLAALVKLRFEARAQGRISGPDLFPFSYEEDINTGQRQSKARLSYHNQVPDILLYSPPTPLLVGLKDQRGSIDPLTALYSVLRDSSAPCHTELTLFDGRRRSRVSLNAMGGGECIGTYRRISGFTEQEMSDRQTFPLKLRYEDIGGQYRLVHAEVGTLWGKAHLIRR